MGSKQVHIAREQASANRVTDKQMVTLVAIDTTTGKNVVRQFSTYAGAEQWLGTFEANNLEVVRLS